MANENQDSRASEEGLASEYKQRTRWQKIFPLIICATSFTVQIFVLGFYKAFGPIYVSLLKEFGGDAASTAWVGSLSVCVSYLSTPLSFEVIHKIKFRAAMVLGACLSGLGLLISSYADSIYVMYITFGLMFGFGSSLCYSSSLLILPRYFTKNWSLAHGIALSGNGLGGLALSPANGMLIKSMGSVRTAFKVMACVSFGVLFTCGMIYQTPEEKEEVEEEKSAEEEAEEKEEKELADIDALDFPETIWKNKPLLVFLFSTYLLNFGYYVPYVHLVKMARDYGIAGTSADLLPGYLSLSQSCGKVFIGKVFSYGRVNRIVAYQISLFVLSLATTFVPTLTSYPGLIGYAIVFGFSDGCGQATNMIIIGDLAGRKLLPKAYSTFLVCSASAFVVGPPLAGFVYTSTGDYSIAFFMCGAMAFSSALCLFVVPCMRDEEQFKRKMEKKREQENKLLHPEKETSLDENGKRDSGIDLASSEGTGEIAKGGPVRRKPPYQRSREFSQSMLMRSWHSVDFKPRQKTRPQRGKDQDKSRKR